MDNTNDTAPEAKTPEAKKKARGFAAMDRDAVREIARKGGKAAHEKGRAHEFTADEARAAGSKGGRETHRRLREKRESETDKAAE